MEGPAIPPNQRPHPATAPVCFGAKGQGTGRSWPQALGDGGALYGSEVGKQHDSERKDGVNWGVAVGVEEGDRFLNYS